MFAQKFVSKFCSRVISFRQKHVLPDLPFDYNALEPIISAEIMQIHHQKHHATYVNNLNQIESQLQEAIEKNNTSAIISLQSGLKFNGGGHINHSIFWTNLCKNENEPTGILLKAIKQDFGNLKNLQERLSKSLIELQGSGWGWLGYDKTNKHLRIATCANQDPLEPTTGFIPLLGIDVWEHAYYLQYKNIRANYVKEIWKVVNWENVKQRFELAQQ